MGLSGSVGLSTDHLASLLINTSEIILVSTWSRLEFALRGRSTWDHARFYCSTWIRSHRRQCRRNPTRLFASDGETRADRRVSRRSETAVVSIGALQTSNHPDRRPTIQTDVWFVGHTPRCTYNSTGCLDIAPN